MKVESLSLMRMGSVKEAMREGSKDRYFQDVEDDIKKLCSRGNVGRVLCELFESIHQFIGGLRAGMGYSGAKDIPQLQEKASFVQITSSGIQESHPHKVAITKKHSIILDDQMKFIHFILFLLLCMQSSHKRRKMQWPE